jgi:hypothetical protein
MGIDDLEAAVDFVLAFAMVHELPAAGAFFAEAARALKVGAGMLLAEPRGHVSASAFADSLVLAEQAGLSLSLRPSIRSSHAALLLKRQRI